MHQVVTAQLAARRAGTQSTKTRAEVRGGGKKPFKQKGTGNARQGSTRAPHFSGGGVALGPKPRKYDAEDPEEDDEARPALGPVAIAPPRARSSSSTSGASTPPRPRTPRPRSPPSASQGKALVVVDPNDTNTIRSFLNLPEVQLIEVNELNAYDVLCNDFIVFSKSTLPGEAVETEPPRPRPPRRRRRQEGRRQGSPGRRGSARGRGRGRRSAALPAGAKAPKADGGAPKGYEIKGNADSGLYHVPGSAFYDRTVAELYFATAEDAEAAGFQLPPSQRDADSAEETN